MVTWSSGDGDANGICDHPFDPEDKELNSRKAFQNIIGQTKVDELMMFWLSVVSIRR